MAFCLYLSKDCGLDDIAAGSLYWNMVNSYDLYLILVGIIVDAIGIKANTYNWNGYAFGRLVMPFTNQPPC